MKKLFRVRRTLPPGENHSPTIQVNELEDGSYLRVYGAFGDRPNATIGLLDGKTVEATLDQHGYATKVRIV